MYDPVTARFMQEDTYRGDPNDPLSLNLYTYVSNNPIMYTDPTGHQQYIAGIGYVGDNVVNTSVNKKVDGIGYVGVNVTTKTTTKKTTTTTTTKKAVEVQNKNSTDALNVLKVQALAPPKATNQVVQTPVNPVLFTSGKEGEIGFGKNLIQPYKEDSTVAAIGKGIVNYGGGTILNILNAPSQLLLNLSAAGGNLIEGKPIEIREREFLETMLTPENNQKFNEYKADHPMIGGTTQLFVNGVTDPANMFGAGIAKTAKVEEIKPVVPTITQGASGTKSTVAMTTDQAPKLVLKDAKGRFMTDPYTKVKNAMKDMYASTVDISQEAISAQKMAQVYEDLKEGQEASNLREIFVTLVKARKR